MEEREKEEERELYHETIPREPHRILCVTALDAAGSTSCLLSFKVPREIVYYQPDGRKRAASFKSEGHP